ncbi:unnamed protein product [Oppiella nova]|uniref:Large ribosomal subunit protein bL21m n=1 Tax=Oppiella nova TaxID=334625 RepID=A0A7R9QVW1_9ACAR|nr:unnamed protein product [Oppiella nova]CAG2175905.1 unnamed protein product [Oppiella nova]
MIANQWLRTLTALRPLRTTCALTYRAINTGSTHKRVVTQELIKDEQSATHLAQVNQLFNRVNGHIVDANCGQHFAVIHFFGKQFLIHNNDMICVRNSFAAKAGETIKLEKCLAVGNNSFTLLGRPLLSRDLVHIEATVVEKSMTNTYFNVYAIPRNHQYRRWRFQRFPLTLLRINHINICHPLNQTQHVVN